MKIRALIILLISCSFLSLQAQFFDDFSDGNISANPTWRGDTNLFIVNSNSFLQLADSFASGTSNTYISTESKAVKNAEWEFKFDLGFDPSSSNVPTIYLMSDIIDLTGNVNGYYVKVGSESSKKDKISLIKSTNGSATTIISGRDSTVANNPSGWIKVTRDSLGNWELFLDTSNQKTGYFSEGTTLDTDHISSNFFGIKCRYTTSRKYLFQFDSLRVTGSNYTDTTKPKVKSIKVLSDQSLSVQFDEPIDLVTGQNTLNYTVDQSIGNPNTVAVTPTDSSLFTLTFTSSFGNNQSLNLTVSNITDKQNNTMVTSTHPFKYFKSDTAKPGDVQINEIMADPNPPVALPADVDWVEFYNRTNKSFTLINWEFSDRSTTGKVKLPNVTIGPREYLVFCHSKDSAKIAAFGARVIGLSKFPNLNASDELLTLKDSTDQIIDQVEYYNSWYGDDSKKDGGFTLEKINPFHPCSGSSNWSGSNDLNGGTPGKVNSTYNTNPETDAPTLLNAQLNGPKTLELVFSKKLDSLSILNATFNLSGSLTVSNITINTNPSDRATIQLNASVEPGIAYTINIVGARDCFGNTIDNQPLSFGSGKIPGTHQVLITEIMAIPDVTVHPDYEYEFVELFNHTTSLISLDSCTFSDLSTEVTLTGALIEPNGRLILCEKGAQTTMAKYGTVFALSNWPSLNNSGDQLTLQCKTTPIHRVNYDDDWYQDDTKKKGGWSLELIDPNNPCGTNNNWKASIDPSGATPGKENSIFGVVADLEGPQLIRADAIDSNTIQLKFDENIAFSNTPTYQIAPSITILKDSSIDTKTRWITTKTVLMPRTIYEITVSGIVDCIGNDIQKNQAKFGLPEPGEKSDIVINEVLFDPYATSKTDYVELINTSEKIINLQNWLLADFDSKKDTLDGFQTISQTPYTLLPNDLVVLSKDKNDVIKHYPFHRADAFIDLTSMPSYPNESGSVVLLNTSAQVIDRFDYTEKMHHPILTETEGVSLERLDPKRLSNDETNWHSAAKTVQYGTPGQINSQHLMAENFEAGVTLEPQTFSPDNNGFEDVLLINYAFETTGNVANIQIFDTEGRKIRQLVSNELLALKGTFSWEGRNDDNEKARAGIYILYFEIFDTEGNVQHFKKACVLALKY